ncbi:MAG: hypothetical protein NDI77_06455 [Geobacteraceae bacterium]|nr:hypothetical protein [Geobacteraceae bacterium]
MDEHYIWLFNKSDNGGLWRAALFSFLLHGVMIAVMATTSVFYPITGSAEKIDVVWLYPSFLLGGENNVSPPVHSSPPKEKAPSPLAGSARVPSPRHPTPIEPEPARKTAENRDMERLPPPSPPPAREQEAQPVAPPAAAPLLTEPEPAEEQEMRIPVVSPPLQTAEAKADQSEKGAGNETLPPPQDTRQAGKEVKANGGPSADRNESTRTAAEKAAEAPAVAPIRPAAAAAATSSREPLQQNQQHLADAQQTAVRDSAPLSQTTDPSVNGAPAQASPLPGGSAGEQKAALEMRSAAAPDTRHANGDKPVEKPSANAAGQKGIFAPPLSGDLKLDITAPPEALKAVKISATFREYPKARRGRPMTKSAARNFRALSPKMTRTAPNTLQAVIEIAEEGVYDFRSLSEAADSVEASFLVKIYENSGRAKTQPAGTRRIGDKGSIARVLMPEGILWDDESAFSGSMEDSESITRFNAETGLVWKEYKE